MGHCGECHTSRAITMQVKAIEPNDGPAYLSGAVIENFFAPSLRNGGPGTIGTWTDRELAQFLKTGANRHGIVFGSMSDVIVYSTQYLTDEDALAAAQYLKTTHAPSDTPTVPFTYNKA
jgi:alcohol dehydrogenase (quinone), cytochrome c subunit